jgi:hypothetical protein
MAGGTAPPRDQERTMTSPAQVHALACALFHLPAGTGIMLASVHDERKSTLTICVFAPVGLLHMVEVSPDDPNPLKALRDDLILHLLLRIRSDLEALSPFLGIVPMLEPLVRLALMLRFGKAYIALRQACAPDSGVGGERGRATHHAYEDAAAALMAHVEHQIN